MGFVGLAIFLGNSIVYRVKAFIIGNRIILSHVNLDVKIVQGLAPGFHVKI